MASSIFLEAPRIPQGPGRCLPSPERGGLADLLPCVAIACVVTRRCRLCFVPHNLTPTGRRQDMETCLREVQGGSLCIFSRCCFSLVCVTCRSLFYLKLVSPLCQMIVSKGPVISVLPKSVETSVSILRDRSSAVGSLKLPHLATCSVFFLFRLLLYNLCGRGLCPRIWNCEPLFSSLYVTRRNGANSPRLCAPDSQLYFLSRLASL